METSDTQQPKLHPARSAPLIALRYRDFRLLWFGQMVSTAGTQMRVVAVTYQLYQLTGSPLALGMLGVSRLVPLVLLGLGSGLVADRFDRRRLMLATQTALMLVSAAMAALSVADRMTPLMIYLLMMLASTASTFDMPARQALIPALVPREHLPNALSLNIIVWQMASIGGPTLGGLVIAGFGVAGVYIFDTISYLAVIIALLLMQHRHVPTPESRAPVTFGAALEGLRFVLRSPVILSTMLLDFVAMFFGAATTLLPIFAAEILHVDERGLGLLYAAPSAGAVTAALFMSTRSSVRKQGMVLLWAVAAYGLCTALFGLSRSFVLSLILLAGTGAADTISMVIRGTMRQLLTPDELRGRMTAVNMLFFAGGPQLGEIEAGIAAQLLGTGPSVFFGGVACVIAVTTIAAAVPKLRRYDQ